MVYGFATRSWRIRVGYRAGSEEVVDGVMDASSVYVASVFFPAYTGGSCSHMSGTHRMPFTHLVAVAIQS